MSSVNPEYQYLIPVVHNTISREDVLKKVCGQGWKTTALYQINTDKKNWVSDSPYLHVFDGLDEIHHQMDEITLTNIMEETGYEKILTKKEDLPNGKALVRVDYRKK